MISQWTLLENCELGKLQQIKFDKIGRQTLELKMTRNLKFYSNTKV